MPRATNAECPRWFGTSAISLMERHRAGFAISVLRAQSVAQQFRTATAAERAVLFRVIAALRTGDGKSTGKLHGQLCPGEAMSRDSFEEVLGAMARAGLVRLSDAMFEKDGKQIPYRKVSLTRGGHSVDEQTPIEFVMKVAMPTSAERKGRREQSRRRNENARRKRRRVRQKPAAVGRSLRIGFASGRGFA